jgi:hypothetical protein
MYKRYEGRANSYVQIHECPMLVLIVCLGDLRRRAALLAGAVE